MGCKRRRKEIVNSSCRRLSKRGVGRDEAGDKEIREK